MNKTSIAFILTSVLRAPFWALYNLLVFILYKDLHASAIEVALFLTLKPAISVLSIYWGSFISQRRDRLIPNIIVGGIVGHLPFFFFPFIDNPWFIVISGILYMMINRGIIPAWMEILKINVPKFSREKVFSYGSAVSYIGGIVLPLLIGDLLDIKPGIWRWLFPSFALLSLTSLIFQLKIPINKAKIIENKPFSFSEQVTQPWKNIWKLIVQRKDFRQYQMGFFLGGMGLMIIQPILPQFLFDTLKISYSELAIAISVCKGIGYALTTRFWANLLNKMEFFKFSSIVIIIAAAFPLILMFSKYNLFWLYFSYIGYGIMQGGSELSWHLSGPVFAKNEDSSVYSNTNLATVGIRGIFTPFLGAFLASIYSSSFVLIFASALSFFAFAHMIFNSKRALEEKNL
ncbi:MAG: MFS transporter [Chlamydiae bacterium]|nr:MFS transporter [Chlamydiota bacterium]